ncbi:MAG: DNA polymerase III subunit gamma/tau [Ruminococcus sp.]|jgi:DNA polymerase-3 subunit gamma/tau|nr:DNA polymerase III subunit gamma/tau [Ruminococcus sp.]
MYEALYRKYRPKTFTDVYAQEHITTTLQNQIKSGKTAHAYLFTGSRGTGKTTCARIFAKAINCLNPKDGNPCLECEICREADTGALPDIIEIDAASNNSVNDIRDLRDGCVYTPEICKVKIYIIDEVHMLSKDAFNALLKIMEEPPPHVKFILATTELHKVIPTVISRCQRFDFRRVGIPEIIDMLKFVADNEGIKVSDDALALIAKTADGGMRDALSLLDTCIAYSSDVTLDIVSSAAGIAGRDDLFALLTAIFEKDSSKAISIVDSMYAASKDLVKLLSELTVQLRNVMMVKSIPSQKDVLALLPEEVKIITEIADKLTLDEIIDKITTLQKLSASFAASNDKKTAFELTIIKLCTDIPSEVTAKPVSDPSQTERIKQLEQRVASLQASLNTLQTAPKASQPVEPAKKSTNQPGTVDLSKLSLDDLLPMTEWGEILARFTDVEPHIAATLTDSKAMYYEGILFIFAANKFFLELIKRKENSERLQAVIKSITGKQFTSIKAKFFTPENPPEVQTPQESESPAERLINEAKENNIPVNTI